MELSNQQLELIEKYIDGALSSEERVHFDELYQSVPEFKKEADFQKGIIQSLKAQEKELQKEKLTSVLKEIKEKESNNASSLPNRWWTVGIAASVLLISYFAFFNSSNDFEAQLLFDQYYQPYGGPSIVRGETTQDQLLIGMRFYTEGQYQEALEVLLPLETQESDVKNELNLLIGNCYLEMAQVDRSIVYFERSYGTEVEFIGEWYVAMAQLKNEDLSQLRTNLENIVNSKSPFKKGASELLNSLPNNSEQ